MLNSLPTKIRIIHVITKQISDESYKTRIHKIDRITYSSPIKCQHPSRPTKIQKNPCSYEVAPC